jgi:urea transporter
MTGHKPGRATTEIKRGTDLLKILGLIISTLTPFIVVTWFVINMSINAAIDKLNTSTISQLASRAEVQKQIGSLYQRVNQLEIDNATIKAELDEHISRGKK